MKKYRKSILAGVVAVAAAVTAALTDDTMTSEEAFGVILAVLTALGVYVVPNDPA